MIKIIKPTPKQTIAAIKSRDFSEINEIRKNAEKNTTQVFDAVVSGAVP